MRKTQLSKILQVLKKAYPEVSGIVSRREDPFRTVVVTALSAHTTDAIVDRISPALFKKYPTAAKLSRAKIKDVEKTIKPVGLYRAKAKNIVAAARMIEEEFGGKVPDRRELLVKLPGVGRKTANVVLIKSFKKPAMPVDTHIFRVANRIGLARGRTPEEVERQLVKIIPERQQGKAHFWLITHGRRVCHARRPDCPNCPLSGLCLHFKGVKGT